MKQKLSKFLTLEKTLLEHSSPRETRVYMYIYVHMRIEVTEMHTLP